MREGRTSPSLADLLGFAREQIAAHEHPQDHHHFTAFRCSSCGVVPLELTIEYHTGSKRHDFKRVIDARCSECGGEQRIFSFTGEHRSLERREKPICECGHGGFLVAMLERVEGDRGLPGFFDEGVIVAQCSACGRRVALAYTD